jgi:hypothetical protein
MSYDKVLPQVAHFFQSFPSRKRYTTDDIHHYPMKLKYHCAGCYREVDLFLLGIGIVNDKPEKNYRKWVVTYDCDLCKNLVSFKYCTPDEELKFVRTKNPI